MLEDGVCPREIGLETQEFNKQLFEQLKTKFDELKASIIQKKENGTVFENPSYPLLKSWRYFNIDQEQRQIAEGIEQQPSSESWFHYLKHAAESTINSVSEFWEGVKRMDFGGKNYAPTNLLETAIELAKNASKLDPYFWPAYIAIGSFELIKNGAGITKTEQAEDAAKVKQAFINVNNKAVEILMDKVIPSIDAQIIVSFANQIVHEKDDVVMQWIVYKEFYKGVVSILQNNGATVVKSSADEGIRIDGVVSLENLAKNINLVEGIHNVAMAMYNATNSTGNFSSSAYVALNNLAKTYNFTGEELESAKLLVEQFKLSGVNIFTVSTYELEKEERDWAATVFVAVAGIAFIYTGLWLINLYGATSTFAATLGSSLVMQGTGDIIKSLIAVGTGNPVDYYRYINAKGMSVGIAILTAGFLEGLSTIADFAFLKDGAEGIFNAAQNTGTFLTKIALTQAATLGTNAVLQNVAKNFIDSDDIAAEAQQEIKTITEGSYREKLAIIYATDKIHEDTTLQHRLLAEIRREASEYLGKYHDDKTEFATGVGTNVAGQVLNGISGAFGLGDLLNVGAEVTKGLIKNSKVISAMSGAIRRAIDNVVSEALSSGAMMKHQLNKSYRTDIADQLFAAMERQEFVNNGEIDYKECGKLSGIKLEGALAGHNLVRTCESVADLLLNAVNYDVLNGQLIGVVSRLKELIQENDIVAPTTGAVAGKIGGLIAHTVEFTSEKIQEFKQARAEGGSEKGDKIKFDQERERSQRETAQKSGLNQKPETGKESGQEIPGQEKTAGR